MDLLNGSAHVLFSYSHKFRSRIVYSFIFVGKCIYIVTNVGETKVGSRRAIAVDTMKTRLLQQFKAVDAVATTWMRLWNLEQWGSVQNYIEDSQNLQVQIEDMSPTEALDTFKRGLKKKIQGEVILRSLVDVNETILLAQKIESSY